MWDRLITESTALQPCFPLKANWRTSTVEGVFVMSKTKICTKCGIEKPATLEYFNKAKNGKYGLRADCRECCKKYKKEYRKENKELVKEYNEQYRKNNKEFIRECVKRYRENNKEKVKQSKKLYREKHKKQISEYSKKYLEKNKEARLKYYNEYRKNNREIRNQYSKKYRNENKEYFKNHYKNNIDKYRIYVQKRQSLKNNLPSTFTNAQWEQCKNYFNNRCCYCGKETVLSQDHFVAVSKKGEYTANNILPVCGKCNSSKHNYSFTEWYPRQEFYSKQRARKILKYLGYDQKAKNQQLALF